MNFSFMIPSKTAQGMHQSELTRGPWSVSCAACCMFLNPKLSTAEIWLLFPAVSPWTLKTHFVPQACCTLSRIVCRKACSSVPANLSPSKTWYAANLWWLDVMEDSFLSLARNQSMCKPWLAPYKASVHQHEVSASDEMHSIEFSSIRRLLCAFATML